MFLPHIRMLCQIHSQHVLQDWSHPGQLQQGISCGTGFRRYLARFHTPYITWFVPLISRMSIRIHGFLVLSTAFACCEKCPEELSWISPLGLLTYIWPCHFRHLTCNQHTAAFFHTFRMYASFIFSNFADTSKCCCRNHSNTSVYYEQVCCFISHHQNNSIHPSFTHPSICCHQLSCTRIYNGHQLKIKFLTRFNDFPSPNYSCILNMHAVPLS